MDFFKSNFLEKHFLFLLDFYYNLILQNFVLRCLDNKLALVRALARSRAGGKPLPEEMMSLFTHSYMRHQTSNSESLLRFSRLHIHSFRRHSGFSSQRVCDEEGFFFFFVVRLNKLLNNSQVVADPRRHDAHMTSLLCLSSLTKCCETPPGKTCLWKSP